MNHSCANIEINPYSADKLRWLVNGLLVSVNINDCCVLKEMMVY